MHYGNRIKWLIKNKGFSQREIATALDVPETTLSNWTLTEYPGIEAVESVCGVLGISVSRFFADLDSDSVIEVTAQERALIKAFGEFSEEQREKLLRIVEGLKGF